jgi:hypothetical protein
MRWSGLGVLAAALGVSSRYAVSMPSQPKEVTTIRWGLPIGKVQAQPFDTVREEEAAKALHNVDGDEIQRRYIISASASVCTIGIITALTHAGASFGWCA